jgi:hypothetical protein
MASLHLVSPWVNFYQEIQAFFKYDSSVKVIFDSEENEVRLYVAEQDKADALRRLLPETKDFGNVTLKINIIPANIVASYPRGSRISRYVHAGSDLENVYIQALRGNRAFQFSETLSGVLSNDIIYIVFANEVVQYYDDNLGDYYGQCSTLYQNIARDIFLPQNNVCYCTDKPPYGRSYYDENCDCGCNKI